MMDWCNNEDTTMTQSKKNPLRRSVSTFGFNPANSNAGVREAKSFTGALQELKKPHKQSAQQHDYMKMFSEQNSQKECECITKEVSSDKIFVVKHEMLTYRGKQYSMSDIATRWKKDCRMWLWKGNFHKRNRSVSEIREKMQSLRLPSSSDTFKRIL